MAPIDIVINLIKQHQTEAKENSKYYASVHSHDQCCYYDGKDHLCKELIEELEGFKKLFN